MLPEISMNCSKSRTAIIDKGATSENIHCPRLLEFIQEIGIKSVASISTLFPSACEPHGEPVLCATYPVRHQKPNHSRQLRRVQTSLCPEEDHMNYLKMLLAGALIVGMNTQAANAAPDNLRKSTTPHQGFIGKKVEKLASP